MYNVFDLVFGVFNVDYFDRNRLSGAFIDAIMFLLAEKLSNLHTTPRTEMKDTNPL